MFFKVPQSSASEAFFDDFLIIFGAFLEHFYGQKMINFDDFCQDGRGMHFGSILGSFCPPFGALLAPFGLPLAPFWLPLAAFWLPFAPFCVPFGSLWLPSGRLWFHFGTLWVKCSFFLVRFSKCSYLFDSTPSFFYIFWEIDTQMNDFWILCPFRHRFVPLPRFFTANFEENPHTTENTPVEKQVTARTMNFRGPGAGICRRQLKSAPGSARNPARACLDLVRSPAHHLCT